MSGNSEKGHPNCSCLPDKASKKKKKDVLPSQDNKTKQNSDISVAEIRKCLEYFLQKQ